MTFEELTANQQVRRYHPNLLKHLQRGQWVSAGPRARDGMNIGRFYGVTRAGVVHVAWIGNARASGNYREYMAARAKLVGFSNCA